MIHAPSLLNDLRKQVSRLEKDLDERLRTFPEREAALRGRFEQALQAGRTASNYTDWRYERCTQAAVAWVLTSTFVRYLEDNLLIASAKLAGPGARGTEATDNLRQFFKIRPEADEHHYLLAVFEELAALPGAARLFDRAHNPLWELPISPDGAQGLLQFWQRIDGESGALIHDFRPAVDADAPPAVFRDFHETRFLGDLYQDLSEDIRKRYALLQTPEFVESFILDYSLEPAIKTFGYPGLRLIDPTCGSGHFLLGAFRRLLKQRLDHEPARDIRVLVQESLDSVYGVDLNPYAVAIARFRLLIEVLRSCHIGSLEQAPGFRINVTTGDSLYHGKAVLENVGRQEEMFQEFDRYKHVYEVEDITQLRQILDQTYHVVVGNPPYITPKDAALNQAYRERYITTHKKYSLGVVFTERFFDLAIHDGLNGVPGFVGLITSNSFMKREFGTKLVREWLPRVELTHVIDTSGAYLPGHGTPTVILLGRNRKIRAENRDQHPVRKIFGIAGEPSTPTDPSNGFVWRSIVENINNSGFENAYISVADMCPLYEHPWVLSASGSDDAFSVISKKGKKLNSLISKIGFMAITAADDLYFLNYDTMIRMKLNNHSRMLIEGYCLRDWGLTNPTIGLWPYDCETLLPEPDGHVLKFLWPWREVLATRSFGKTVIEMGLKWFEYYRFLRERYSSPYLIPFAFVATHNHFVLNRGGKVFNRSAPVIKLPEGSSEEDHLALIGLLNSSTACFWMKQVFYPKGGDTVGTDGARVSKNPWEDRYEHDGTKLKNFPVTDEKPLFYAQILDRLAQRLTACSPAVVFENETPSAERIAALEAESETLYQTMVYYQEELDWRCYQLYGLLDHNPTQDENAEPVLLRFGLRAFELNMASAVAAGELETIWFSRHGCVPTTELPDHWPPAYRALVEQRRRVIAHHAHIGLIEKPEFKRRWSRQPFGESVTEALRLWLLRAIEAHPIWSEHRFILTSHLADEFKADLRFCEVVFLYRGSDEVRLDEVIEELMAAEAVPLQAAARYQGKGRDNHAAWCATWEQQRREDAIQARCALDKDDPLYLSAEAAKAEIAVKVGPIPVPPKYKQADFRGSETWRLRGPLDVPKERFLLFAHATSEGKKASLMGWAGWDHSERAKAIDSHYLELTKNQNWTGAMTLPILAALRELLPWLQQYHAFNPHGTSLADFFQDVFSQECRAQELSPEDVAQWTPPEKTRQARGRRPRS